ncbi:MAG: hypothetical protein ACT4QF_14370 [Sporichthyaceae bacterium]
MRVRPAVAVAAILVAMQVVPAQAVSAQVVPTQVVPTQVLPGQAVAERCSAEPTADPVAGEAIAGSASGQGLFGTYDDWDTVLEGGTLVPPDLAAPVATAAVDRTGLGEALAASAYSPYNDAAGMLNASAGTALSAEAVGPTRASVSGRPPQRDAVETGGACALLADGPIARSAAASPSALPGLDVRIADVRSFAGRVGSASTSHTDVVLTGIQIGELRIEEIVLAVAATADGAVGSGRSSSTISGVTVAGERYAWTPKGLEPLSVQLPKDAGLASFGFEVLSSGTVGQATSGNVSRAWATGPTVRFATDDGRTLTVVLGRAQVSAERGRG